jgi:hypothetical protein
MQEVSMESNQQSSILSRSQTDEDIVEIEGIIHSSVFCFPKFLFSLTLMYLSMSSIYI